MTGGRPVGPDVVVYPGLPIRSKPDVERIGPGHAVAIGCPPVGFRGRRGRGATGAPVPGALWPSSTSVWVAASRHTDRSKPQVRSTPNTSFGENGGSNAALTTPHRLPSTPHSRSLRGNSRRASAHTPSERRKRSAAVDTSVAQSSAMSLMAANVSLIVLRPGAAYIDLVRRVVTEHLLEEN